MGATAILALAVEILKNAPALIHGAAEAIEAAKTLWSVASAEAAPTEQQVIDYGIALEAAHRALQDS
jgi:hypothetical protein